MTRPTRDEGNKAENADVKAQLAEAVETLRAIRAGEVDALIVADGSPGHQVFTLASADRPYRMFVETMRDGAVTVSEQGVVLYANRRMGELLSLPLSRIIGARLTSFIAESDHALLAAQDDRPESRDLIEVTLLDASGLPVPAQVGASTLEVGSERCVCLTFADLTQLKRDQERLNQAHEQEIEASRLKSEFVSNMSHEIRTPLNGVIAMAGLLLETELDGDQREYAHAMRTSGAALLALVDEILDFSKVDAGRLELDEAPFELPAMIDEVCSTVPTPARSGGAEVSSWIADEVPSTVSGDRVRVCQVLTNLLSNAVKFTPAGAIRVRVTGEPDSGGSRIRFEVSDTGIGIDPAALDGIFESFAQADGSTTREYGGTGLGLAISKQLVELMGGEIGVRSAKGKGSRFWFTLPLPAAPSQAAREAGDGGVATAPAEAGRVRPEPAGAPDRRREERRRSGHAPGEPADRRDEGLVLLAEDNEINQLVAVKMLEKHGFRVDVAVNGRAALEMWRRRSYRAVFMDCQMPELDGYETTLEIRRLEGPDRHTPIIAMTANTMKGDREKCLDAGMDDYVGKPVDADALRQAIERSLGEGGARPGGDPEDPRERRGGPTPWLDRSVLDEVWVGDAPQREDMARLFAGQSAAYLAEMGRAIEAGNAEALQQHAHELKAGSASVGAVRMAELCDRLCQAERAEVLGGAPDLLRKLERASAQTQAAWERERSSAPPDGGSRHAISPH